MEKKKPNWIKIKNEYICSETSHRKLAEKYGVSYNTLRDRAIRENWTKSKNENRGKIIVKSEQKAVEKIAEKESDYILDIAKINTLAAKRALEILEKGDELKPSDLRNITAALKDVGSIAALIGQGGAKNSLADEWARGVIDCEDI